jgi:hypothetical protein
VSAASVDPFCEVVASGAGVAYPSKAHLLRRPLMAGSHPLASRRSNRRPAVFTSFRLFSDFERVVDDKHRRIDREDHLERA